MPLNQGLSLTMTGYVRVPLENSPYVRGSGATASIGTITVTTA
jgi:hypothetical protein